MHNFRTLFLVFENTAKSLICKITPQKSHFADYHLLCFRAVSYVFGSVYTDYLYLLWSPSNVQIIRHRCVLDSFIATPECPASWRLSAVCRAPVVALPRRAPGVALRRAPGIAHVAHGRRAPGVGRLAPGIVPVAHRAPRLRARGGDARVADQRVYLSRAAAILPACSWCCRRSERHRAQVELIMRRRTFFASGRDVSWGIEPCLNLLTSMP